LPRQEDAFWKAKSQIKAASHDDVRTLLEGDFIKVHGILTLPRSLKHDAL
jgi:hypothetical protein